MCQVKSSAESERPRSKAFLMSTVSHPKVILRHKEEGLLPSSLYMVIKILVCLESFSSLKVERTGLVNGNGSSPSYFEVGVSFDTEFPLQRALASLFFMGVINQACLMMKGYN